MSTNSDDKRDRDGEDGHKSPEGDGQSPPPPIVKLENVAPVGADAAEKESSAFSSGSQQQPQHPPLSQGGHPPPPHHPPPGVPRMPPGPQGYYQPIYPPPPPHQHHQGGGEHAGYPPPPPRGYENGPPPGYGPPPPHYAVPPGYHYMPPYGMYPPPPYAPHPHHMYGAPPPHQQPPPGGHAPPPHHSPYAYPPPPHDPSYGGRYPEPGVPEGHNPYGPPPPGVRRLGGVIHDGDRKLSTSRASADSSRTEGTDDDDDESGNIVPGAVTARLKTYIKPRIPSTQEVLDRRSRKNAQSRARAAKLRQRIAEIELKPEEDRTEEEVHLWAQYEQRRQRKNNRSRERALEKKEEIDRILAKPEKKRTKIEKQFLETALSAKKRKNEGDRLRRQRLKELGLSTKGTGVKPGISARGPLPPQYQHLAQQQQQQHGNYPQYPGGHHNMSDIPMSPLPTIPHHHPHHMQSPGFGSPGMMPNLSFPSPSQGRGGPGGTPNRQMPYMPPPHGYDPQMPSPGRSLPPLHDPAGGPQLVEHRRHADGSTSFSIGGRNESDGAVGGGHSPQEVGGNVGDPELLPLDNDNEGYGGNQHDSDVTDDQKEG